LADTGPVQFVVRSSESSWMTTGVRSLVSLTSSSSTVPSRSHAWRNAGIVSSANVGTPASTEPPRCEWIFGAASAGADSANATTRLMMVVRKARRG
jgi:hypothetical protein